jgi:hypothetical protein
MKSRRPAKRRAPRTAAVVDTSIKLQGMIEEEEQRRSEIRAELKAAGRFDLACGYLKAPAALRDLADYLWGGKSFVYFGRKHPPPTELDVALLGRFPRHFVLRRNDSAEPNINSAEILLRDFAEPLIESVFAKVRARFRDRIRPRTKRRPSPLNEKAVVREWAIELSWLYPLEEWACIFPAAALAGDQTFIEAILARSERDKLLDNADIAIAIYWYGCPWRYPDDIPPLRHWSDKAACEFVAFITGERVSVQAYKMRKSRLGLTSTKPTVVGFAEYNYSRQIHCLTCKR